MSFASQTGSQDFTLDAVRFYTGSNWLAYDRGDGCHIDIPAGAGTRIDCLTWASTTRQNCRLAFAITNNGNITICKLIVKLNGVVTVQTDSQAMGNGITFQSERINFTFPTTQLRVEVILQLPNGNLVSSWTFNIANTQNPNGQAPGNPSEPIPGGAGSDDDLNPDASPWHNLILALQPYIPGLTEANAPYYLAGLGLLGVAGVLFVYMIAKRK